MIISRVVRDSLRRPALMSGIVALAFLLTPGTARRAEQSPAGAEAWMNLYGADALPIDRAARDFRLFDQVEWRGRPGSSSQTALLFGDPSKPGMYVQLLKRGPDDWSQPHAHSNDRYITVIKGTMLIGTGGTFDKTRTVAVGPGGVVRDIAGQMHYDGTGPEGLIIEIIGMGPVARVEAEGK